MFLQALINCGTCVNMLHFLIAMYFFSSFPIKLVKVLKYWAALLSLVCIIIISIRVRFHV